MQEDGRLISLNKNKPTSYVSVYSKGAVTCVKLSLFPEFQQLVASCLHRQKKKKKKAPNNKTHPSLIYTEIGVV